MINFTNCIRCGSKNIDKLMVNTRVRINYPEKRNPYSYYPGKLLSLC